MVQNLDGQILTEPVLPEWCPRQIGDLVFADYIFRIHTIQLRTADDATLKAIAGLPGVEHVRRFSVDDSKLTNASARHFLKFEQCKLLVLTGGVLDNAVLEYFWQMPKLNEVYLRNNYATPLPGPNKFHYRNGRFIRMNTQ
jgi:hypothetical protein